MDAPQFPETRRTRRQIVVAGTAGAAGSVSGVLLAACGVGGESPGAGNKQAAALPAELTWMGWSMNQEFLVPAYEEAARLFANKHSASKLVLLPAAGDYRPKYTALVAAGTPPDVADMHWQQHVRDVGP